MNMVTAMSTTRTEARLEDLGWMAETGESASGAARRLGITLFTLETWCRRHGAHDVLHRLFANEPCDPNMTRRAI